MRERTRRGSAHQDCNQDTMMSRWLDRLGNTRLQRLSLSWSQRPSTGLSSGL
jgi:hypothetical protein